MTFIQIIDYETDRPAEIDEQMRQSMQVRGEPSFTRLEHTQDHDNPRHFLTIVEFPSYELAMENSTRPRRTRWPGIWRRCAPAVRPIRTWTSGYTCPDGVGERKGTL